MAENTRGSSASSPSGAGLTAIVNGPNLVSLWGPDRIPILVAEQFVDEKLRQGYSRAPAARPEDLVGEVRLKGQAALEAVDRFWQGVESDGYVDTADSANKAAAERAMDEFVAAWGEFHQTVQLTYPTRVATEDQPAVFRYTDERDRPQEFRYSPQQVAVRRPDGQLLAVARTDVAMFEQMGYVVAEQGAEVAAAEAAEAAAKQSEEVPA